MITGKFPALILFTLTLILLSAGFTACQTTMTAAPLTQTSTTVEPTASTQPSTPDTPTPVPLLTIDKLGVTDPNIDKAFSGATFTQEADGSYSVSAISYNGENKVTQIYTIDKATFTNNPDINNAYAPATVNATDSQGNKATLIWDGEHGAWRVPFAMVDNSDFSKTSQIPFVAEGDEKIVGQSALLYLKDHPPFNDVNVESYKKYGGNSLLFEYSADQGKDVKLKSKGNDNPNWTPDNATMKATPFWFYHKINGVRQDGPLMVILDPSDPNNPKANEYKVISALDDYFKLDMNNLTTKQKSDLIDAYYGQKLLTPYLALYCDAQYQKSHPLLASLLTLPGNDPSTLTYPGNGGNTVDKKSYTILQWSVPMFQDANKNPQKNSELPIANCGADNIYHWVPLPSEIQTKLLPIIFGVH